ncbi:MAG: hypothetical protein M3273_05795 [Actinomycetota bacterium]|nr:hypothetical protein [Actinomycetota bacterium]
MKKRPAGTGRLALVGALIVVLGACSDPQGTEPGNSLLGEKNRQEQGGRGDKGPGGRGRNAPGAAAKVTPPPGGGVALPEPGSEPAQSSGAAKTETEVTSSGTDPARASVLVTEPDPDAEKDGLTPPYPEVISVGIEGLGTRFRATLTFAAELPDRMPDDKTYMVAGIGLTGTKDEEGYAFGAQADTSGWKAYGGTKKTDGRYPGTLAVDGSTIVFTLPWSAIDGPRAFEWYGQSSWFRSLAGTTSYSFDAVPNEGPARFPAD